MFGILGSKENKIETELELVFVRTEMDDPNGRGGISG